MKGTILESETSISDKELKARGKKSVLKEIGRAFLEGMSEKELMQFLNVSVHYEMIGTVLTAKFKGSITI